MHRAAHVFRKSTLKSWKPVSEKKVLTWKKIGVSLRCSRVLLVVCSDLSASAVIKACAAIIEENLMTFLQWALKVKNTFLARNDRVVWLWRSQNILIWLQDGVIGLVVRVLGVQSFTPQNTGILTWGVPPQSSVLIWIFYSDKQIYKNIYHRCHPWPCCCCIALRNEEFYSCWADETNSKDAITKEVKIMMRNQKFEESLLPVNSCVSPYAHVHPSASKDAKPRFLFAGLHFPNLPRSL